MIRISTKARNAMHLINAFLWLWLLVASWSKNELLLTIALFSMSIIVALYYIMGATKNDALCSPVPLIYPALTLPLIWTIAFIIIFNTRGTFIDPSNFILGMHPSMAGALIVFWIGSLLTTALSYALFFNHSVDDQEWENFLKEAHHFNKLK